MPQSLAEYYRRLKAQLELPFGGEYRDGDTTHFVIVHGLYDPDRSGLDERLGLICDARQENRPMAVALAKIEVPEDHPNRQLLDEYARRLD